MSATKTDLRFPTLEELDATQSALGVSYNHVERVAHRVRVIVNAWEDETKVHDRPTFETIGLLADYVDGLRLESEQLQRALEETQRLVHDVISMRHECDAAA